MERHRPPTQITEVIFSSVYVKVYYDPIDGFVTHVPSIQTMNGREVYDYVNSIIVDLDKARDLIQKAVEREQGFNPAPKRSNMDDPSY